MNKSGANPKKTVFYGHSTGAAFLPVLVAALLGLLFFFSSAGAQAASNPKYASIVMDAETGLILHQSNADKILHPASLAKVMTLMLTFDAIERGDLRLRDRVIISRHAANMIPSKLDLPVGSSILVEDAIYALVTKSANDVAVALAEKLGGSEKAFAAQMNRKAKEIGMNRSRFRNASGLHDRNQISTARDIAKMSRYLIKNYPAYYHYFSTRSFTYNGKTYRNHNRLMDRYEGMDGLKTGYISASGFNLAASAVRNNRRLIGVVFGGRTGARRNAHMATLLNRSFAKLDDILIAASAVPIPPRRPDLSYQLAAAGNMLEPASGESDSPLAQGSADTGADTDHGAFDISDEKAATISAKWASINAALQNGTFKALIGEGDYDPAISKRIETGLLAIAALKGDGRNTANTLTEQDNKSESVSIAALTSGWAIQIGAFSSRSRTEAALKKAREQLPASLAGVESMIVPLKTKEGWLFRGRLSGYDKQQAASACQLIESCLMVSPRAF